jgi:acyl carrier protein
VLGIDMVGADDPFLDLDGDSLRATRVVTRIAETFAVEIPLAALLAAATVAELGALVRAARGEAGSAPGGDEPRDLGHRRVDA